MPYFLFPLILLGTAMVYAAAIWRRLLGWRNLSPPLGNCKNEELPFISVLVPVRNEAENLPPLLADFTKLRYPLNKLEVWIIDDHSEDSSAAVVQAFQGSSPYSLHLLPLKSLPGKIGKKAAIAAGVKVANGDVILCTDGDCRVPAGWAAAYGKVFAAGGVSFLAGPVCFDPTPGFFEKVQLVEFAALVGVGAGSIAMGHPSMCNGANIGYVKRRYEAVQGFSGNEHVASGDDEFLMHRIHRHFPGEVQFLKTPEALVTTRAQPTLRSFFGQRVRWASKWRHYEQSSAQGLALLGIFD